MTSVTDARKRQLTQHPESLKRAREWAGLSQTELAKAIPVSRPLISYLESGTRSATRRSSSASPRVLNCPVVMLESKNRYAETSR